METNSIYFTYILKIVQNRYKVINIQTQEKWKWRAFSSVIVVYFYLFIYFFSFNGRRSAFDIVNIFIYCEQFHFYDMIFVFVWMNNADVEMSDAINRENAALI